MGPFEYLEPKTVDEAASLLSQYSGESKIYSGGTSLVPQMRKRLISPKYIISLCRVAELDYIHIDEKKGLRIGSLTTIRTIEKSPIVQKKYEMISKASSQIASIAVRNVATIGGNLCNASPWSDLAPILIALSAKIKLINTSGERVVSLENIFTGLGSTILEPDELMTEVQTSILPSRTTGIYMKCTTRGGSDLCLAGVAVVGTLDSLNKTFKDIRIAIGGVRPAVLRAHNAEALLKENQIDEKLIERAAQTASNESRPTDHIHGSAEYRKAMVKVYAREAIKHTVELAERVTQL